jgi:hypothetical protein
VLYVGEELTSDAKSLQELGWTESSRITINGGSIGRTNYAIDIVIDTATLISQSISFKFLIASVVHITTFRNYQLLTTSYIDRLRADGGDLRFAPDEIGTTTYDHTIESGLQTSNTLVFVRVPEIPASSSFDIWMIIGNADATYTGDVSIHECMYLIVRCYSFID